MSQNAMEGSLTLKDLTKLMGKLTSTIQAILPAKLQIRLLQQIQIKKKHDLRICDYSRPEGQRGAVMVDSQHANLQWKISANSTPDQTIFSDTLKNGWAALCQGITKGGRWSSVEKAWHVNVLQSEAVRLVILFFTKFKKVKSIHLRIDNMTALSYLLNMGGTQNKHLIKISKEIWGYLIERKIHWTAEYIPSLSNQTADWAS